MRVSPCRHPWTLEVASKRFKSKETDPSTQIYSIDIVTSPLERLTQKRALRIFISINFAFVFIFSFNHWSTRDTFLFRSKSKTIRFRQCHTSLAVP